MFTFFEECAEILMKDDSVHTDHMSIAERSTGGTQVLRIGAAVAFLLGPLRVRRTPASARW